MSKILEDLRVSRAPRGHSCVYRMGSRGFIPHFRVGHKVLYRRDAVVRWVQEQESKATGGPDGCH